MNNTNQLKAGVILSYIQMFIGVLVMLFYTPLMLQKLGASEYGLYNTIASTISLLSILSLGFSAGYIRYYVRYTSSNDTDSIYKLNGLFVIIFSLIGIIALIVGGILAFNLDIIFSDGLTQEEYRRARILMLLFTLNLAESFPASVLQSIISAHEKFIVLKSLAMTKTIVSPLISILILFRGYKSIALVVVTIFVSLCIDAFSLYYVKIHLKQRFIFKKLENGLFIDLLAYTSLIAINIIVDQINWNIDKVLLARFKGTFEVTIYSTGFTLYQFYQSISSSVSSIFNPRIFKISIEYGDNEKGRNQKYTDLFIKVGRIQFLILSLLCIGIVILGRNFISIWVGPDYMYAYYVAIMLIIPASIPLIQNIGIDIQRALNMHKFRSYIYLCMAVLNFILSIFLGKKYGAIGVSIGTAASLVIANGIIINIFYYKKCGINIPLFWKNILKMLIGVIAPVLVGLIMDRYILPDYSIKSFIIKMLTITFAYIVSIWVLSMNEYEKSLVKGLINRFNRKKY